MSEKNGKKFIAYDYKEVLVEAKQVSLYIDAYENFGWETDENSYRPSAMGKVCIHFRRDRKIMNKTELTRLQRNFDACMEEIKQLELSKSSSAKVVSSAVALAGTAFMAGSVFAVTAAPPMAALCVILAVPGVIGWLLPFYLFKKIVRRRTKAVEPLIEEKFNELYEVCEKGCHLLQ